MLPWLPLNPPLPLWILMSDNKCVSTLPNERFTHTSTRRLALLPSPRTCTEHSPRCSNEIWTVLRHLCLSATHHKSHRPIKTNECYIVFMLSQWTSTRWLVSLSSPRTYTAHHPRCANKVWTVLQHQGLSATCHKSHKPIKTSTSYTVFVLSQWMTTSRWEIIWSRRMRAYKIFWALKR